MHHVPLQVWKRSIAPHGSLLTCGRLLGNPQKQSAVFITAKAGFNVAFAMIGAVFAAPNPKKSKLPHGFTAIAHSMFHGILQPGSTKTRYLHSELFT